MPGQLFVDEPTQRQIEVNKVYRVREGDVWRLYEVTKLTDNSISLKDMKSGKSWSPSKSTFRKKLNDGEIYVTSEIRDVSNFALHQESMMDILYQPGPEMEQALADYDYDVIADNLLGVTQFGYSEELERPLLHAAFTQKGYGPTMFLIAIQKFSDEGLVPDPNKVTPAAKKVFKEFYEGRGKSYVTSEEVESSYHKEDYLNQAYKVVKPLNLNRAVRTSNQILQDKFGEKLSLLADVAGSTLTQKMREIWGMTIEQLKKDLRKAGAKIYRSKKSGELVVTEADAKKALAYIEREEKKKNRK